MTDQKEYIYYIPVKSILYATVEVTMPTEDLEAAIDAMYELDNLDAQILENVVETDLEIHSREDIEVHEVEV